MNTTETTIEKEKTSAPETKPTKADENGFSSGSPKQQRKSQSGFRSWVNRASVHWTLKRWHRAKKIEHRRKERVHRMRQNPYAVMVNDLLYMIGFWTEYLFVCAFRAIANVARAVFENAMLLIVGILRPLGMGIYTLLEELFLPFRKAFSGARHLRQISATLPQSGEQALHNARAEYLRKGTATYAQLVLNVVSYVLPIGAAVFLFATVQNGLNQNFVLEVLVDGETVGYVESEQVFESASEDLQSRINTAKALLQASGVPVDSEQWEITPTYVLATGDSVMNEGDVTDAIMQASSDEISNATAVYVDGSLKYITSEGDHLRSFLQKVLEPYEDAMDSSRRVEFLRDIDLVDGVYFTSSISAYNNVVSSLSSGSEEQMYEAKAGDTLEDVLAAGDVTFAELQRMNPHVTDVGYTVDEGELFIVSQTSAPSLQVKTVNRTAVEEEIQYRTVQQDSDQYDYGKLVTGQQGQNGLQRVTYDFTYIDGEPSDVRVVSIDRLRDPVDEVIYKGTKLSSGMYAATGTGSWLWPVPQYSYVSRWMSSYHKGADICAPYGVDVIASDGGYVEEAGWHNSYGNYVLINHGNGWRTRYGHMSALYVAAGQAVKQGQAIGAIGSTGNSTGNHCHFEMIYNGSLVSAQEFFGGRF